MDLTIVVPCYNEADNIDALEANLLPVVQRLRETKSVEILFIDDGSRDGTGDLIEGKFAAYPYVRVIRHDRNRGLGAAVRTGFRQSAGEVVITTDSDGTYRFESIPDLLRLLGPDVDVVTASCYHPLGGIDNVPGYRVLLSKGASLMYRVLLDWRIHTYTCLFRAYRRHVVEAVEFDSDGFLSQTEILAQAILTGCVVRELPAILRVRRYGASKARVVQITLSHLRYQWHLLRARGSTQGSVSPRYPGASKTSRSALGSGRRSSDSL